MLKSPFVLSFDLIDDVCTLQSSRQHAPSVRLHLKMRAKEWFAREELNHLHNVRGSGPEQFDRLRIQRHVKMDAPFAIRATFGTSKSLWQSLNRRRDPLMSRVITWWR
jgi:hypothetical protein